MRHGGWRGCVVCVGALGGCIPEPVLRPRDAAAEVIDARAVDATLDAGDAALARDAEPDAGGLAAPRLLRPLSFAVVGTQLPELRWELPARASGARVEVCADRDCARVERTADAMGGVHRVTEALGAGVHFWRVRARYGGELGPPSAAWEFVVQGTASSMVSWYGFVDVDRDGVADIVVGAPAANAGRGGVLVYRGKDDPARTPVLTLGPPESQMTEFGTQVSSAGDFDGDGAADIAVLSAFNGLSEARVSVYRDPLNESMPTPTGTLRSSTGAFSVLAVVRALGDVNGDGFGDLGVGVTSSNDGRGEVQVFLGGPSGLSADRYVAVRAEVPPQARFGAGFFPVGDLDADGFDDVVVRADLSMDEAGRVFLVRGRSNFVTQVVTPIELDVGGARAPGQFGSGAGDIDRDGRPDFVLSAADGVGLFYRSPTVGAPSPSMLNMDTTGCPKLGRAFAGGFDFNGDQLLDLVARCEVASPRAEVLFYTGPTLPLARLSQTLTPPTGAEERFASQIASYGDFNADGLADVVVTTPAQDTTPTQLVVYWGRRGATGRAPLSLELPAGFGVGDPLALSR